MWKCKVVGYGEMSVCISAENLDFRQLNKIIRQNSGDIKIDNCCGQRFIGSGLEKGNTINIDGIPGNALGAYLDGAEIYVKGNVQDAVGDTMNNGKIVIDGNAGDALGYAMRGGIIYVNGNSGYRTGIHMKQYKDKKPVVIIGGRAGSFLGEYLAGGIIVILGLGCTGVPVGNFTGTGMHGGKIYIRTKSQPVNLPEQVSIKTAGDTDIREVLPYINEFAGTFNFDSAAILKEKFYLLEPNGKNPYKQLYTVN